MTHIFITYLGKGEQHTPPQQKGQVTGNESKSHGESGNMMEELLFGGTVNFFREMIVETPEYSCGVPYVKTATGRYRITQETVDRTVNLDFEFPYEHSDIKEDPKNLKKVDRNKDPCECNDPLQHPNWPKLRDAPLPHDG